MPPHNRFVVKTVVSLKRIAVLRPFVLHQITGLEWKMDKKDDDINTKTRISLLNNETWLRKFYCLFKIAFLSLLLWIFPFDLIYIPFELYLESISISKKRESSFFSKFPTHIIINLINTICHCMSKPTTLGFRTDLV